MSTETRPDGSLWVQEFSLKDFAVAIQTNVQEGFVISLANDNYPQGFSGHFTVGMVKPEGTQEAVAAATGGDSSEVVLKPSSPTRQWEGAYRRHAVRAQIM
jgi:hypothetical protein